jgi:hypothetical protein
MPVRMDLAVLNGLNASRWQFKIFDSYDGPRRISVWTLPCEAVAESKNERTTAAESVMV